jgi:uncharacterized membrane protein
MAFYPKFLATNALQAYFSYSCNDIQIAAIYKDWEIMIRLRNLFVGGCGLEVGGWRLERRS